MILKQKHKTRLINHVTYRRIKINRTKTATTSTTNTHQKLSLWTPSNCSSFSKAHQIHQHKSFLTDQYHTPTLAPHLGSENWIPVQVLLGIVAKLPSFDCQAPVVADFWPYRLARVSSLDHFTAIVYDNRKPSAGTNRRPGEDYTPLGFPWNIQPHFKHGLHRHFLF